MGAGAYFPPPIQGVGRRQRDSAFIGVSDEEVRGLARDATAPKDLRRRAQAEEKNRKLRNIQKRKR